MTDLALQWMSFRRTGRIADIPADLTGGTRDGRLFDDLVTLGHAERTGTDTWQIAPPVLAGFPRQRGFAAVLCGARTPTLLESLEKASTLAGARMISERQAMRPDTITVTAPSLDALTEAAVKAGIVLQPDAGLRMLACTPSIRDWPRASCAMVEGRVDSVLRFSRSRMRWVDSTLTEATSAGKGFFRIKRDWDQVSLLKSAPMEAWRINERAGRLAAAAKCKVVRWTSDSGVLALPAWLYPPSTMARGLALCSGHVPGFDPSKMEISFDGVQPEHLTLFLALTRLRQL